MVRITATSRERFCPVFEFGSNLGIYDCFGTCDGADRLQGGGAENRTGTETDSAKIGALGVTRRPFLRRSIMKLIVGISVTWQLRGQTWWMYSQGITFGILPTMSARRENFII